MGGRGWREGEWREGGGGREGGKEGEGNLLQCLIILKPYPPLRKLIEAAKAIEAVSALSKAYMYYKYVVSYEYFQPVEVMSDILMGVLLESFL